MLASSSTVSTPPFSRARFCFFLYLFLLDEEKRTRLHSYIFGLARAIFSLIGLVCRLRKRQIGKEEVREEGRKEWREGIILSPLLRRRAAPPPTRCGSRMTAARVIPTSVSKGVAAVRREVQGLHTYGNVSSQQTSHLSSRIVSASAS